MWPPSLLFSAWAVLDFEGEHPNPEDGEPSISWGRALAVHTDAVTAASGAKEGKGGTICIAMKIWCVALALAF
jgi:hypothetical protein